MIAPDGRGYFIKLAEPGPQSSQLLGDGGAATDLLWQVRDSVRDLVTEPILFRPRYQTPDELPDVVFHNEQMIISHAMRTAMEPFLKDHEFFSVRVELNANGELGHVGGGEIIDGYWWLNCWRRLDLVDWERSSMNLYSLPHPPSWYKNSPLRATKWNSLVLRTRIPADEHFFGIAYVEGEHRYLSEAFWRCLSAMRLKIKFAVRMFAPGDPTVTSKITEELNS